MQESNLDTQRTKVMHDPEKLARLHWMPLPLRALTVKQRGYLKGLAHHFKPVVRIGQEGISEGTIGEIRKQLLAHELIKVKWASLSKEEGKKKQQAQELAAKVGAHYVHLIGQVVVLYRELEDQYLSSRHTRKIQLPT